MKTNTITPDMCLQRLQALCAKSEHCEYELREKMKRWEISPEKAGEIIEKLRSDGFIDDERFARAYALDKLRYNQWGREKIRFMLRGMRIPSAAVEYGLGEIDDDEYEEIKRKLIEKKEREIKDTNPYVRKAKLQRFLYSRGFYIDE